MPFTPPASPDTVAARARTSSRPSGLRLCGMMLLPVHNSTGKVT